MTVKIDPRSAAWLEVEAHCRQRMAVLRTSLESDLDHIQTAQARAHIREIKGILDLVKPAEPPRASTINFLP